MPVAEPVTMATPSLIFTSSSPSGRGSVRFAISLELAAQPIDGGKELIRALGMRKPESRRETRPGYARLLARLQLLEPPGDLHGDTADHQQSDGAGFQPFPARRDSLQMEEAGDAAQDPKPGLEIGGDRA